MHPVVTVQCWTGAETKALRQAMRLSIRAFAAYLGIDARTVNKWEARRGTITLRPHTQELMDTALQRAPEDVQTRFAHTVRSAQPAAPEHDPHAEPSPCSGDDGVAEYSEEQSEGSKVRLGDVATQLTSLTEFSSSGDVETLFATNLQEHPGGSADELLPVSVEGSRMRRRKTLQLGLAVAIIPEVLDRVLSDAATEAMEFTQLTGLSAVGQGTLDHLELVVNDLNRDYAKNPLAEQFVVARAYRLQVNELIRGRHTLKELQELYVYAACLSELLAWLALDLGNFRTAQACALDCYVYANETGQGELCGWAANAMATIAMYSEHPDSAMRAALQGAAKVPASHPLAVSLRAHAARAYARLGQREPCEALFAEAQRLHERLPARAPRRFTMDTGGAASYALTAFPVSAYLWLRDFGAARAHGEAALAAIESTPPGSGSHRQAFAQLVLATALVGLGTPDDAVALGSQALTSTRVVTSGVVTRARDLDRALVSRYPGLTCVREFHAQYRHVAQGLTAAQGES